MNDNQRGRGPALWPLLLIPLAIFVAKGVARRRDAMWASGGLHGPRGGYDMHGRYSRFDDGAGSSFRFPPKIESALDSWHERTHDTASTSTPTSASGSAT